MKKDPINILLVEGDKLNADLAFKSFNADSPRYNLTHALDLNDARNMLRNQPADLIITGFRLPDGDCAELLSEKYNSNHSPFVIIKNHDEDEIDSDSIHGNSVEYVMNSRDTFNSLNKIAERALNHHDHIPRQRIEDSCVVRDYESLELIIQERTSKLEALNEELRKKENLYRMIIENTTDVIWTMDMSLKNTYCSPSINLLTGFSCDEFMQLSMEDMFEPESLDKLLEIFSKTVMGMDSMPKNKLIGRIIELEMKCKNGATVPVQVNATIIRNEDGDPVGIHGLAHDISERKLAQEILLERKQQYKALFENSHSIMLIINPENAKIADANQAACIFYGYPRDKLTEMKIQDLYLLSEDETLEQIHTIRSRKRHHYYLKNRMASGAVRDVEVYTGPINHRGKDLLYSIIYDITDKKRADEETRKFKEYYEHLLKISPNAIFTLNNELIITNWNDRIAEITGYNTDERLGKKCSFCNECLLDDDCYMFSDSITMPILNRELVIKSKEGKDIHILKNADVISNDENRIIGAIISFTDISKIKETKRKLRESIAGKKELINEFHELGKSSINIISEVFNQMSLEIKDLTILNFFKKNISQLELLSLIYENIYQSDYTLKIDFKDYITKALKYFKKYAGTKSGSIKLIPLVENIALKADTAIPCAMILNELLSNAIEHAFPNDNRGKIKIEFTCRNEKDYSLSIIDTGIGLDKNIDISESKSYGFQIINRMTELLNGKLTIERKKGTVISIKF